jgi:cytoskeleton protein RodZ
MEPGSFGEHLKRERELRGVTLDEISTATRIATRFLEAIENEQWERLPGGVFNRGFVRAVARYLGLDEEDILAEYGQAAGERSNIPVWTGSPPAVTPEQPWLAWILAGVVVLSIAGGGWFAVKRIVAWRAARRAGHPAPALVAPSPLSPTLPQGASAEPAGPQTDLPTTPSAPAPPDPPNPASVRATNATSGAAVALELKIEAAKTTQVTVEADDQRIFDGPITGGENRTFRAHLKFLVSADDSGALLLRLNGETLAPIGPPGRAGKIVLSRVSLRGAAGGRN